MATKNSFIFYTDWLKTLDKIPAAERLAYYEEIVRYAIEGERPQDPVHDLVLTQIFTQLDKAAGKYEEISKKRREAGKASARKRSEAKAAAEEPATQETPAERPQPVDVQPASQPRPTSQKPRPAQSGKARGFIRFYEAIAKVEVPKEVSIEHLDNQYRWRAAEGMPAYLKAVHEAISAPSFNQNTFLDVLQKLDARYPPSTPYPAFKLALSMQGLPDEAITAIAREVDKALMRGESDVWDLMAQKVEYMKDDRSKVHNITAFIQNRGRHGT